MTVPSSIHEAPLCEQKAAPDSTGTSLVSSGDATAFSTQIQKERKDTGDPQAPANTEGKKASKTAEERRRTAQEKSCPSRGDAILSGLLQSGKSAQEAHVGTSALADVDENLMTRLVDRILVSTPDKKDNGEVHIRLHDDVLHDTNIVLRMKDGVLQVHMHTANAQSALVLHQNVDGLRQRLEGQRFSEGVEVRVLEKTSDKQTGEQSGAHGGQTGEQGGDERSRGRYLWDQEGTQS